MLELVKLSGSATLNPIAKHHRADNAYGTNIITVTNMSSDYGKRKDWVPYPIASIDVMAARKIKNIDNFSDFDDVHTFS
jgi:hypothetical protein